MEGGSFQEDLIERYHPDIAIAEVIGNGVPLKINQGRQAHNYVITISGRPGPCREGLDGRSCRMHFGRDSCVPDMGEEPVGGGAQLGG
jgi:hypothetical protein